VGRKKETRNILDMISINKKDLIQSGEEKRSQEHTRYDINK
jgi:hypothetical protein